ncbi:armadillo-type protein [Halteromyces radiatus]|uniref:armadillo-type protein n=1 Tax=Halteromyces radiatus TaxID=101107 RepID=UPI00221F9A53|nr:armadillo-type protein [Halteromyces radiatus]KAI8088858.1 armadillo-type protein [Halteromyces radiatus]
MNIENLLESQGPLDVALLDTAVEAFYTGESTMQKQAERVLTTFQHLPDVWQHVPTILETSQNLRTKFLALRILDDFITVRWHTVPLDTRLSIRNYIVQLVITISCTPNLNALERILMAKLNTVLVQIIKKDWPQNWPDLISELVASSQTNLSLCENNMRILKLLSEEIFDYSKDQLTMARSHKLQSRMKDEVVMILGLCQQVLTSKTAPSTLIQATLETVSRLLSWIPHKFISETQLVPTLISLLPENRLLVMECFTTIVGLPLSLDSGQMKPLPVGIYTAVIDYIQKVLPIHQDVTILYQDDGSPAQLFIYQSTLFFTTILSKHVSTLYSFCDPSLIQVAHTYLLRFSQINDLEVWKTCLEYWEELTTRHVDILCKNLQSLMADLRQLILEHMLPPDEVLLVEDDEGEVTKEYIKGSDTFVIFQSMGKVLSNLTQLDTQGTITFLQGKLISLTQSKQWTLMDMNKLCWAIGSISGSMDEHVENSFLSLVLENLIQLLNDPLSSSSMVTSEASYMIVSCLVYIGTRYIRFSDTHPIFLNLILTRLLQYMHDPLPVVRDMACESFMKICQGCPSTLANTKLGDFEFPILWIVIRDINSGHLDLDISQMELVYGGVSRLIAALPSKDEQNQAFDALLNTSIKNLSQDWETFKLENGATTIDRLKSLWRILRLNYVVASQQRSRYQQILHRFLGIFIHIYQAISLFMRSTDSSNDPIEKRWCKKIKQEIIQLIKVTFTPNDDQTNEGDADDGTVMITLDSSLLYQLVQVILDDYRALGESSEAMILSLVQSLIINLKVLWPQLLGTILEKLFEPTLMMIKQNFSDFPDHRLGFYNLLLSMSHRYLLDFLHLPPTLLSILVDSMLWGIKHTNRDISELALQTCYNWINFVSEVEDEDLASDFYKAYYLRILTDLLTVTVDPDYESGLDLNSQILARMLELVQNGDIYTQVFDTSSVANPLMSNTTFLQDYVQSFFMHSFPLLQKDQITVLVMGMFEYSGDHDRFKTDLYDFLLDIRQVDDIDAGNQRQQEEQDAELELLRYM